MQRIEANGSQAQSGGATGYVLETGEACACQWYRLRDGKGGGVCKLQHDVTGVCVADTTKANGETVGSCIARYVFIKIQGEGECQI